MEFTQTGVRGGLAKLLTGINAKSGTLSIIDQGIVSSVAFLTMAIIGRTCSREEFGIFSLNFSIVLFIIGLQTSLITLPFTIRSPKLRGKAYSRYMSSTLAHQMILCMAFVLFLSPAWYLLPLFHFHLEFVPVLRTLTLVLTFVLLKEYIRQICYARLQVAKALTFDAISGGLQLAGLFALGWSGLLTPVTAFLTMGIACGVIAAYWLVTNRRTLTIRPKQAILDFRSNWEQGRWMLASGIAWSFGMNSYSWILAAFWGTATVGVWSACAGIASLGNPLFMGIQNFLAPKIAHFYARSGIRGLTRFIFKASAVLTVVMLFFLLILVAFGEDILKVVYSHKYSGNGTVISALGLNLAVMSMGFSSSRALYAMSRTDVDCIVNIMSLIILIAIGFFLVKTFGLLGAACALIISSVTSSLLKCVSFTLLVRRTDGEVYNGKQYPPQD